LSDLRDAREWSPIAPQLAQEITIMPRRDPEEQDEACLALNVFTPATDDARRPVLFWIHGGAYHLGSGSQSDPTAIARRGDVVVVTTNYRLGLLGFLADPALADPDTGASGNWGLLDQVMALEWVRDNIAGFGGDPSNVTIFGISAGSHSVSDLCAMPMARGLFRRGIAQSGPPVAAPPDASARVTAETLDQAGGWDRLREMPPADLLRVQARVMASPVGLDMEGMPFRPAIDDVCFADDPLVHVTNGSASGVELIVGTCRDEMSLWAAMAASAGHVDDEQLRKRLRRTIRGADADGVPWHERAIDVYDRARTARGAPSTPEWLWIAIETDRYFRSPSLAFADAQLQHAPAGGVWCYVFEYESPLLDGRLGACHGLDSPFTFGLADHPAWRDLTGGGAPARQLQEQIIDAWVAFARTGDPSHPGIGSWPRYDTTSRPTLVLDREVRVDADPMGDERQFFAALPDAVWRRSRPGAAAT
jgi:para-nitrobenzyl esterase